MRTLTLAYYVSLDGKSADADNGIRDVMMAIDDAEQEAYFVEHLWDAGTFIMGRNSYEGMAPFWPTSAHPSAPAMNAIEKVVFSRSPIDTDGWPARVASGDTAVEIAALKAEPGKQIVALGGTAFQHSRSSSAWSTNTDCGCSPPSRARVRRCSPRWTKR